VSLTDGVTFQNPPIIKWSYYDHDDQVTKLFVAVDNPAGSENPCFDFNENGDTIFIDSSWTSVLFTPDELFQDELYSQQTTIYHPKIQSLKTVLKLNKITKKSCPKQRIKIPLGMKVVKEKGNWKIKPVMMNNSKVMLLEFKGFQENEVLEEADKTCSFK
jgi:hypothetical protein